MTMLASGGAMAGISYATRRSLVGVAAVLVVAFVVVVAAAALAVTSHGSGGSPTAPPPAERTVTARSLDTCTWHRNGWYC
jgi:hypothetical protein